MNVEHARFNMIEQQVRPWNVLDPAVLERLALVRREDFVPPELRSLAFADVEMPLGEGQVMLPPRVDARLLQALAPARHEKVLEIGAGSGWMAALLGHMALEVTTMESRPALAAMARQNLARAGLHAVRVVEGDARTLKGSATLDAVLLSGSVHDVPRELLELVKDGGRVVAVVGDDPMMRAARFVRRGDRFERTDLFDTVIPRLDGFEAPTKFRF